MKAPQASLTCFWTVTSKALTVPQVLHLLDLPPELILHILALAVVHPEPICIHDTDCRMPIFCLLQLLRQPSITRVNRILREEGLKLFYRRNTFHGVNWSEPLPSDWIAQIDETRRRGMRVLVSSGWEVEDVVSHLESAAVE